MIKKNSPRSKNLNKLRSGENFSFGYYILHNYILGAGIAGKLNKAPTFLPAIGKIKVVFHTFSVFSANI